MIVMFEIVISIWYRSGPLMPPQTFFGVVGVRRGRRIVLYFHRTVRFYGGDYFENLPYPLAIASDGRGCVELVIISNRSDIYCYCFFSLTSDQLLIGFETGLMVLWDLKTKKPECRWQWSDSLKSIDWHFEGKQFTCSHNDGSLTTWNVKPSTKPANIIYPHGEYTVTA